MSGTFQMTERVFVLHEGRKLLFFGGFDYHRLSQHPEVIEAAAKAARDFGLSTSGSRTTTGTHALHEELEDALAHDFEADSVLAVGSGYLANLVAVQAIADESEAILVDDDAHRSLRDAANASCLPLRSFRHLSMSDLAYHALDVGAPLVATDGVFGARGEMAPLREYAALVTATSGWILVDDSHAAGLVGPAGRGAWEACGTTRRQLVQTGSLGKALGGYGGFIAADRSYIARCRRTNGFVGSTALPPPYCAAALASLRLLRANPAWITRLQQTSLQVKARLNEIGLGLPPSPAPVLSVLVANQAQRERMSATLLEREIFPSFTTYPGAPEGGHFRFALSSAHSIEQIERLVMAIKVAT